MSELLSTKQVAEMTGIQPTTLRYWRHIDQGPASFALGICCSLLIHSRSASSALLSGIWTLEAVFYGYFALLDGLKPLFLFPTTLDPQITFWPLNRVELLGTALLLGAVGWFLLGKTEGLLRGSSGGE